MSTSRSLHVLSRLTLASLLQIPVLYWIYHWQFGPRFTRHSYLVPAQPVLLEAGVSAAVFVVLFPVFVRGDSVQKLLAAVLAPLPLLLFGGVAYWILRVFHSMYA
jgi:hypothetical protein